MPLGSLRDEADLRRFLRDVLDRELAPVKNALVIHHIGRGSPQGVVSAPVGHGYWNLNGGVGSSFWIKESGTGNTGWAPPATGGSESTAVADTATLDLILTGTTITGNVLDSPTVGGATPAQLRDRSTHTGTQLHTTVSDFDEAVDDRVAALVIGGTGITVVYNDAAGTFTINGSSLYTDENAQDAIGAALTDTATIDFTYDDAGNTIKADARYPKQTEVDFGATPVYDATFTVTDANVSTSSRIVPSLAGDTPTGKDADELEFDDIFMYATPGTGQFSLYCRGNEGYLADKYKIDYVVV